MLSAASPEVWRREDPLGCGNQPPQLFEDVAARFMGEANGGTIDRDLEARPAAADLQVWRPQAERGVQHLVDIGRGEGLVQKGLGSRKFRHVPVDNGGVDIRAVEQGQAVAAVVGKAQPERQLRSARPRSECPA